MSAHRDLYISVDIETDGKIPGDSNLLTLGAVPVMKDPSGIYNWVVGVESFYYGLHQRPGAASENSTMDWWSKQDPRAFVAAFEAGPRHHPGAVMELFRDWVKYLATTYGGEPVLVASPIIFDGGWIRWYMNHYLGSDEPFGHRGIDMKSVWMGMNKTSYASASDGSLVALVTPRLTMEHHALHDAVYQADIWRAMLELRG